jgi:hypothetical protein
MPPRIGLKEIPEKPAGTYLPGSSALQLDGEPNFTLRFRLTGTEDQSLEALRHARRSLLREELTLGRESGEPSLDDAVFSPSEIVWVVRPEQRTSCLQKLEELLDRANRALEALALS